MQNIQSLSQRQKDAISQSIPALGANGATDPERLNAGEIIAALFNLGGNTFSYTTNATANTQDTVAHGLPYTPRGYIVIDKGAAVDVYTGAAADAKNLYLKATVAAVAVTLLVF